MLPERAGRIGSGCVFWIAAFAIGMVPLTASAEVPGVIQKSPASPALVTAENSSGTPGAAEDSAEQAARIGLIGWYHPAEETTASWILTSLFSQGSLSGTRADWVETGTELLYRASPALYFGGRIETRKREYLTDVLYSVLVSQAVSRMLEWHAAVTVASDPVFSADQAYAAGLAWRANSQLSLLLDYSRLEFVTGSINQYKPGATLWFTERTFLTGRYTYGRAFEEVNFEAYLLRLDLGLSERFRVALAGAHGSDPEKELAIPRVIITKADTYSAYGHVALCPGLELILGAEYEDRKNVYTRTTGTVGLSLRF